MDLEFPKLARSRLQLAKHRQEGFSHRLPATFDFRVCQNVPGLLLLGAAMATRYLIGRPLSCGMLRSFTRITRSLGFQFSNKGLGFFRAKVLTSQVFGDFLF